MGQSTRLDQGFLFPAHMKVFKLCAICQYRTMERRCDSFFVEIFFFEGGGLKGGATSIVWHH